MTQAQLAQSQCSVSGRECPCPSRSKVLDGRALLLSNRAGIACSAWYPTHTQ